jgi:uncharacterized membrane protein
MTPLAIALIISSAAIHAMRELLTKKAADKQVFIWWYKSFSLLFFLPPFIYFICKGEIPTSTGILIGVISGFTHFIYWLLLSKSYEHGGDLSHVYPIMRSSSALILLISVIFLKEEVSLLGVIGIFTVTAGVYLNNLKKISLSGLITPIKAIFTEKPTRFAFLTLLGVVAYSTTDKIGVSHVHPLIFLWMFTLFSLLFFTPYILKTKKRVTITSEWENNKRSIIINGLFSVVSYYLILVALTFTNLSYVGGLRQISIVFAVLLGGHVLKEKHKFIRLLSAIIIFTGALLIAMAS